MQVRRCAGQGGGVGRGQQMWDGGGDSIVRS